jgi:predicted dehydrogenase
MTKNTGTPVNVGIVGCGQISAAYFNAAKTFDIINVASCADINMEAAKAKAEKFGVKAVTVDELISDPGIEIVLNLTIPKAHAEIMLQALESGKHAYSEKPLALTFDEGKKIIATAKAKGLKVGCAPDTFLGGGLQTCRKLIDDGGIGRPTGGTAIIMNCGPERYYHAAPKFFYERGGGPMFDLGPYYITALVNLLGPVKRLCAITTQAFDERIAGPQAKKPWEKLPVEIPTHLSGVLEFHNGAGISVITSFDVWKHGHSPIEIYGTDGSLSVPDPNTFGGPVQLATGNRKAVEWSDCPIAHIYTDNMRSIGVADMAYGIRNGRNHRCSGELACHVLEIMETFEKSSLTGKHIELESSCERPAPLPLGLQEGSLDYSN